MFYHNNGSCYDVEGNVLFYCTYRSYITYFRVITCNCEDPYQVPNILPFLFYSIDIIYLYYVLSYEFKNTKQYTIKDIH